MLKNKWILIKIYLYYVLSNSSKSKNSHFKTSDCTAFLKEQRERLLFM